MLYSAYLALADQLSALENSSACTKAAPLNSSRVNLIHSKSIIPTLSFQNLINNPILLSYITVTFTRSFSDTILPELVYSATRMAQPLPSAQRYSEQYNAIGLEQLHHISLAPLRTIRLTQISSCYSKQHNATQISSRYTKQHNTTQIILHYSKQHSATEISSHQIRVVLLDQSSSIRSAQLDPDQQNSIQTAWLDSDQHSPPLTYFSDVIARI
ncbi:cannabidiolic acid synthase-like 2-like [Dorcoceras hygrometricum]|uniref:Cannabidiolic acid synthase-like 2-like n=1 Tax=Dorcoceras hygrometricum TaxID=472368 RepID=A0A2Z7D552_9LAMI|nr:cannabidiolic acid synthase-like 2-like [Dorcoceras hygrometricum]